jgi:hypothetical protein
LRCALLTRKLSSSLLDFAVCFLTVEAREKSQEKKFVGSESF